MKQLRWGIPDDARPRRPYRDSALLHLVLAAAIVGISLATGASLTRALGVAVAFFVVATAWSWWRWRVRLAREAGGAERTPGGDRSP